MDRARWQRIDELFGAVLALPRVVRQEYLRQACGDDAALREEVEALLAAHAASGPLDQRPANPFLSPAAARGGNTEAMDTPAPGTPGTAAEETPGLPLGSFLGPYELLARIGAGGMGEVYRARGPSGNAGDGPRSADEVAIKVIRGAVPTREALQRFAREVRTLAGLHHPNLLTVHDVGAAGEVPYVVTELLAGETLRHRLRRGPLPLGEALDLARQLAAGIGAAHAQGIVHRDLKPDNVFLTTDGRLKILDFGVAKRLRSARSGPEDESLTGSGMVLGTLGYTAPEQLRGDEATPASDLFSLGALLYEMLSGRRAFPGSTTLLTISAVLANEPAPLGPEGVPAAVEAVVRRCLAKDPAQRFAGSAELLAALDALAGA